MLDGGHNEDDFLLLYRRRWAGGSGVPRITLTGQSIAENAEVGDLIGTLSVANSPEGVTWTFALGVGVPEEVELDGVDDTRLEVAAALDYETLPAIEGVQVIATPSIGSPIERTFAIGVTNVLEVTLVDLSLSADDIDENSAEDTVVGAIVGAASGSMVTLHDSAGGRFKLSGGNVVAGATPTDYEAATSHNITLRETHPDAANSPHDTVIAITVVDDPDDTDTVPAAFEAGDWSIAAGDEEADVTIADLPADGGDAITDIEYRLDGGSWVSSGGTAGFTISGLTNDTEYDVQLRAVNGVGAGAASDTKSVTPEGSGGFDLSYLGSKLKAGWHFTDLTKLWQNSDGTSQISADGQTIGRFDDMTGGGRNAVQATSGHRGQYKTNGMQHWLQTDGVDDKVTSLGNWSSFGSGCTIVAVVQTTDNMWQLIGNGGNSAPMLGLAEDGGASGVTNGSAGSPSYFVNRVALSAATRNAFHDAMTSASARVITITGVDLTNFTTPSLFAHEFFVSQLKLYGLFIVKGETSGELAQLEDDAAGLAGITL